MVTADDQTFQLRVTKIAVVSGALSALVGALIGGGVTFLTARQQNNTALEATKQQNATALEATKQQNATALEATRLEYLQGQRRIAYNKVLSADTSARNAAMAKESRLNALEKGGAKYVKLSDVFADEPDRLALLNAIEAARLLATEDTDAALVKLRNLWDGALPGEGPNGDATVWLWEPDQAAVDKLRTQVHKELTNERLSE